MNVGRRRFADELYEVSHAHDQALPRLERFRNVEPHAHELEQFTSLIEAAPGLTQTVVGVGAGVRLAVRDRSDAD